MASRIVISQNAQSANCIVCGAKTEAVLRLGHQPLANHLLEHPGEPFDVYDLGLAACGTCSHGQLTHFVDPEILFSRYLYASGTSGTLRAYFDWFAAALGKLLKPGARILEIACNDGSFLSSLTECGFDPFGVDPAVNLTDIGRARGNKVMTGFFPAVAPLGSFDAVIAMNVLAHTPDPSAILDGVKRKLAPDGLAFIQTSQAMMLENGEFDTIYHEHYSFFTPRSMRWLCERNGLRIDAIVGTTIHGGSAVFVLKHAGASPAPAFARDDSRFLLPASTGFAAAADYPGQNAARQYAEFARSAQTAMNRTHQAITRHRQARHPIALAGVAAKSMTFIRAVGIDPDYYLDEADLKIGRYVPGTGREIEPFARSADLPDNTVFLLGAWNFAPEIMAKLDRLRSHRQSTFLSAFPTLSETSSKAPCAVS